MMSFLGLRPQKYISNPRSDGTIAIPIKKPWYNYNLSHVLHMVWGTYTFPTCTRGIFFKVKSSCNMPPLFKGGDYLRVASNRGNNNVVFSVRLPVIRYHTWKK